MIAPAATVYEATALELVATRTECELRRAPERLANWRLQSLDWLLRELEEVRLYGDRALPAGLRARIVTFAELYDAVLAEQLLGAATNDLDRIHDALFDAQGRVMIELSQFRRTPSWQEIERLVAASESEHEEVP